MTKREARPFLSIIMPARNEERRLPPALQTIAAYLRQQSYRSEVLVVENGSTDNTSAVVEQFQRQALLPDDPFEVRLMHSEPGKGAAVRVGMLAGKGDYLVISDTDLAVPIEEVEKFLPPLLDADRYGMAIASREGPGAVRHGEPPYRHVMGRVFNFVVKMLAVSGIQDTQCGFKSFSRKTAQLVFPLQTISGWGFDVELLYIAQRHGVPIEEIPVTWHYGDDTKISPMRDTIEMVVELLRIRRNGRRGLYDPPKSPARADEVRVA